MLWDCFGNVSGTTVAAVYAVALAFGLAFNWFTGWCRRRGYITGYTALFVVAGVSVTVGLMAFVSVTFTILMVGAFICSGTPMIIGDMWDHMREREREVERLRAEARRLEDEYRGRA
jgi:hypothetical protein